MLPRPKGLPRKIPAWAWKALRLPGQSAPYAKPAWFWVWRKWRLAKPKPVPVPVPPKPVQIEMYDDVNVSLIPVAAEAVAGYVDGKWPTLNQLKAKFPKAQHVVSIAVFARDNADALDVEPGDATISEAASWVKRQKILGNPRPIVYTSLSQAQTLVNALASKGLVYSRDYLLWTAHYNFQPHLCNPKCGFGFKEIAHATQWTDRAGGKSLDESLCSAEFFT